MHILISGAFWAQPNTGSGQYLHNLARELPAAAPQHRYTLLLPQGFEAGGPPPAGVGTLRLRTPLDGRSENGAKLWFEQVAVPEAVRTLRGNSALGTRHSALVLHVPYAAPPLRSPAPVVATVHDIIWRMLPEYAGSAQARAYFRLVSAAARRAAHLITDSGHSRGDMLRHLGARPERVSVVHLAPGEQYRPQDVGRAREEVWRRYGVAAPFVYYVGGYDARKNVPTLLRAWGLLARGGTDATLVLAGRALGGDPRLFPDIDAVIEAEGIAGSVRRIDVPRDDGPLLYAAATAAAYPSRYEGFGLPPLEAMRCGTPALVSNASSLPEVTGDAALLLDPDDPAAWAAALRDVLHDAALRERMRARGVAQAARFSWRRVAEETAAVYDAIGRS
jgi:glycosyltransferase involved in cell wall biosynthesis